MRFSSVAIAAKLIQVPGDSGLFQKTLSESCYQYSCRGNFLEISGMENFRKFPEISNLIFSFPDWLLEIHFTYY